jgi:hypothetical protein
MTNKELREKLSKIRNEDEIDEKDLNRSMNFLIFHEEDKNDEKEIKVDEWPF